MSNLNRRLDHICRLSPDKPAVLCGGQSLSFARLWRLSNAAASFFSSSTTSAAVGIMLPAVTEYAPLYFGALLAGKTAVPLNFLLTPRELWAIISDAGLDCVVTSREITDRLPALDFPVLYLEDLASSLASAASTFSWRWRTGVRWSYMARPRSTCHPGVASFS